MGDIIWIMSLVVLLFITTPIAVYLVVYVATAAILNAKENFRNGITKRSKREANESRSSES